MQILSMVWIFLATASTALASDIFIKQSWDTRTVQCTEGKLTLEGSNNFLKAKNKCSEFIIRGNGNMVEIEAVDRIHIFGNMNKVQWQFEIKGKEPEVTTLGIGNKVEKKPTQTTSLPENTEMSMESPLKVLSQNVITVDKNKQRQTIDCGKGANVIVQGNENALKLKGRCIQLHVTGDNNRVQVESIGTIIVSGSHNQVQFQQGIDGKEAIIKNNGKENKIIKQ